MNRAELIQVISVIGMNHNVQICAASGCKVSFDLHDNEFAHLHTNRYLHVRFTKRVRKQLLKEGHAEAHPLLPNSGWVALDTRRCSGAAVGWLLRLGWALALAQTRTKRWYDDEVHAHLCALHLSAALWYAITGHEHICCKSASKLDYQYIPMRLDYPNPPIRRNETIK